MKSRIIARPSMPKDAEQIGQLIYDTVRNVNINDYNQQQVEAWAPDSELFQKFEGFGFVAELDGKVVGFANLTEAGLLHRLFVHKDHQGMGIGKLVLAAIEAKGKELGFTELNTAASITAKPFFQANGWEVLAEQTVELRGMSFTNYKMKKMLS